ncbi:PREDICTED: uncharacterized protein LOC108547235 [Eufriesea mexicana]|uniref:uncharacterized protein LOC108547235 n=1 Tax=Eufriesea mexicana TaxID=516756 RepID=UPI00083BD3F2|nr:PREDICTED: uncharacterized protein LOC108547235 [Eufriesea mexicana]
MADGSTDGSLPKLGPDLDTSYTDMKFAAVDLPDDVFIRKFAIWRGRAFLAIPRWQKNGIVNNGVTVYEAIWPESSFLSVRISKVSSIDLHNKLINDGCRRSVMDLHVDVRGRLWLLDVPENLGCPARVIVHNLKRNNQLVSSTDLTNVPTQNLRALVVDYSGNKGYIGDPGDESIIAYIPEEEKWWRIKMIHGPEVPRVFSTDLAISWKNSTLYLTGSNTLNLFSINLEEAWNDRNSSTYNDVCRSISFKKWRNATIVWHGTKMGTSSGLFCDVEDGLHYFMSLERASVRWDTKLPLKAESHSVLVQNQNCPCISDYAMDGQKILWGLINSRCPNTIVDSSTKVTVKSRTTRIGKYSASRR